MASSVLLNLRKKLYISKQNSRQLKKITTLSAFFRTQRMLIIHSNSKGKRQIIHQFPVFGKLTKYQAVSELLHNLHLKTEWNRNIRSNAV